MSPPDRKLAVLIGLAITVIATEVFLIAQFVPDRPSPPPVGASHEERAALTMIRLGAMNWMTVCAYESGRQNVKPEDMAKSCSVDWHLGEDKLSNIMRERVKNGMYDAD